MQISTFVLYGIVEAIVFLLLICLFLLVYLKKQKNKNLALRQTLQKMLTKHKSLRESIARERVEHSTSNTYKKQINDQLLATREYHKGLDAGQDIALDLNPESPPERQTAAIRHAVLMAEKEALNSSTDGTPNWQFLQAKFQQLIQFYVDLSKRTAPKPSTPESTTDSSADTDNDLTESLKAVQKELAEKISTLETLEQDYATASKRIGNLEKFKKLFFDMEKKWEEAKTEAELYYQRLQGLRDQVDEPDDYDNLLNDYHNVYSEFELTLQDFDGDDSSPSASAAESSEAPAEDTPEFMVAEVESAQPGAVSAGENHSRGLTVEIMNSEKQALEELKKLRNLTADQHRLISKLQQQLEEAQSIEEKEALITELQKELKRQIGFVTESESCIQLLENELSNAMGRLKMLESSLTDAESELQHVPKMQQTIRQFAHESKAMLLNLTELERLNEQLQSGQSDSADSEEQDGLIEQMQTQLQALQSQYAELEERYLEAKMSD